MGRADGAGPATRAAAPGGAGGDTLVVGVLTTSYPRFPGDYAGCFVEDKVNDLLAAGHTVEVFAAGGPDDEPLTHDGPLTVWRIAQAPPDGLPPLFYGEGAPEALERRGLITLPLWAAAAAFWGGLCEAVRRRRAALDRPKLERLISHWLLPCGAAALALAPDLPLRAYAHSGDVALLERLPGGATLARWLGAHFARVAHLARVADVADVAHLAGDAPARELIFVTRDLQERFAALTGSPVGRVEPLTVPGGQFFPRTPARQQAARRRLGLTRPTVVSTGRLVPIKGFDVLLAACARLQVAGGGAPELVILGDGAQRAALLARAQRLGVPLRLPGFVPRPQLGDWLAAADVYAQPSRSLPGGRTEGLPIATLEALAVGLPVVATRTGGLAELALQNGFDLVPPDDAGALADALARHLAAPFSARPFVTAV